ncbi:hypothetical protein B0J17DRAFT_723109 [Rhizoctonia solani]|nr:hypothetical protein B0J17DRAFT_723109 [Rhizoctonia solani]
MSTITKLDSPDRALQKVSTLIDMVTIRQRYRRSEALLGYLPRSVRPSVRFADLTPAARILTPECSTVEPDELIGDICPETNDLGDAAKSVSIGNRNYFKVEREEDVFLASKAPFEVLSDHPNASQKVSRPLDTPSHPEPARKRQRVDIDSIVF